jgi:GTP-binding protein HflX
MHEVPSDDKARSAVLVAVQLPGVGELELAESLIELGRLAKTLGLEVIGAPITQRRDALDPGAVLGTGKREELAKLVEECDASFILVDHELTPSQARNLSKACGEAEVMDRTAVILEIFRRHAHSRAAKAQVEMVRLKYLAPRLREQGKGKGDRERGGIGGKGAGESALELDRRKIRDRIAELAEELAAIEVERRTQRARRQELSRAALVGYTNAGKSTLMRGLTGSDVLVADKLFATLDTTVRALEPSAKPRILISDTVGFIEKLPHDLVESFKSTLDEALEASLLVHVVDASDRNFERQLRVTEEVLDEIGAGDVPRLLVLNKIDRLDDEAGAVAALAARWPDALPLCAKRPDDVARLRERLIAVFAAGMVEREILVPYDQQSRRAAIFEACAVLEERYTEDGVVFRVKAPRGFA